jgi:hypothetical protein
MLTLEDEGNGHGLKVWMKASAIITKPLAEIVNLFICLIIYGSVKDAGNSSDYIRSNVKTLRRTLQNNYYQNIYL